MRSTVGCPKPAHTIVEEGRFDQSDFGENVGDLAGPNGLDKQIKVLPNGDVDDYQQRIAAILQELGAPARANPRLFIEAKELVSVGLDIYGREQRLTPEAAAAWNGMRVAAERDGEIVQIVSAFRSVDYQKQIIQRKLATGQSWKQILRVSALPGFSEHHTGRTIDVTTPGSKVLEEEFENTSAFRWLARRAREFGFAMTYSRGNAFGVAYEPWHWTFGEK